MRLYIDNNLLIDKWQRMERTKYSHTLSLSGSYHTVRMEYFEAQRRRLCPLDLETCGG